MTAYDEVWQILHAPEREENFERILSITQREALLHWKACRDSGDREKAGAAGLATMFAQFLVSTRGKERKWLLKEFTKYIDRKAEEHSG